MKTSFIEKCMAAVGILIVFGVVITLVGGVAGGVFVAHIGATNGGEHTGYVTAVEQEGWIWKTYRAYVKTDPQSSQEDQYCITDLSVVDTLRNKVENREIVTVRYSAPFIVWNWQCGSESSIINSIK